MCLGIPVRITRIEGIKAEGEIGGVRREVDLSIVDGVEVGDYVILHAGFAIEKVDEKEAEETLRLLREFAETGGGSG